MTGFTIKDKAGNSVKIVFLILPAYCLPHARTVLVFKARDSAKLIFQ